MGVVWFGKVGFGVVGYDEDGRREASVSCLPKQRRMNKAYRHNKIAFEISIHVDADKLTQDEKNRLTILQTRTGALIAFQQREIKAYKRMLANPQKPIPALPGAIYQES